MSFRDKFLGVSKTTTDWADDSALVVSDRVNDARLAALRHEVKSAFDQGIERLAQGHLAASVVLQGEIAYQADKLSNQLGELIQSGSSEISSAVEQGSADIVLHIQRMSDYLGAAFSDIRWAVERQTEATKEALRGILHSFDNESRQYFEQGVECYEMGEYSLANERFGQALAADPTNHFVYQYLGFMAVAEDHPGEALRNFTLARKFASNSYHQALATAHLARSYYATGNPEKAAELAYQATQIHDKTAKFWYESAGYHARVGDKQHAVVALREAIRRDWTYWAVVLSDTDFDNIQKELQVLLDELRREEKVKAQMALNELQAALKETSQAGFGEQITEAAATHHSLTQRLSQENVYVFQDIAQSANEQRNQVRGILADDVRARIEAQKELLREAAREKNASLQELQVPLNVLAELRNQAIYRYYPLRLDAGKFTFLFFLVTMVSFYTLWPVMESMNFVAVMPFWLVGCAVVSFGLAKILQPVHRWYFLHRPRRQLEANIRARRRENESQIKEIVTHYNIRAEEIQSGLGKLERELKRFQVAPAHGEPGFYAKPEKIRPQRATRNGAARAASGF